MTNQQHPNTPLKEVESIRQMMERSSRFISLSGLSGVVAGLCALAGALVARYIIFEKYYTDYNARKGFDVNDFIALKWKLLILAAIVFFVASFSAFYFTWRKTNKDGQSIWNYSSRRLIWNMIIPLGAGALFILALLQQSEWKFIAPACLIFYGLALLNASKYTLTDIRYLGYCEIVLGLISTQFTGYGLYFWGLGFGLLHIIYGIIMWLKYERTDKGKIS